MRRGPRLPSLRRRNAAVIGCLVCVEAVLLVGAWPAIYNVVHSVGSEYVCPAHFAALPGPVNYGCGYSLIEAALYFFGVFVVLGLIAWSWRLAAGWMLRPLSVAAQTVRRLGPHNLGQRIRLVSGPDQYKELADAIDDALDRLAAGDGAMTSSATTSPAAVLADAQLGQLHQSHDADNAQALGLDAGPVPEGTLFVLVKCASPCRC